MAVGRRGGKSVQAVADGDAVRHARRDATSPGQAALNEDAINAVGRGFEPIDRDIQAHVGGGNDADPVASVVGRHAIDDRHVAGAACGRPEGNPTAVVTANPEMPDRQRRAAIEHEPGSPAETDALDCEPAQVDVDGRAAVDGDPGGPARYEDS